MALIDMQII